MKIFVKKITILFFLLVIFSCQKWVGDLLPERPNNEEIFNKEEASPEFRQGWEDGCEVGMAGGSNTFYQMFYRNNKVDGYKMAGSSDYQNGWGTAFWYCYRRDWVKQKNTAIWSATFGGYR